MNNFRFVAYFNPVFSAIISGLFIILQMTVTCINLQSQGKNRIVRHFFLF